LIHIDSSTVLSESTGLNIKLDRKAGKSGFVTLLPTTRVGKSGQKVKY